MLNLSRKPHETILIDIDGRPVRVKVWSVGRGQVKIAVWAPRDISVLRQELVPKDDNG